MGFYKNQSGRPISVTHAVNDACVVPPNHYVEIDPRVERQYDTKRLVQLGVLVRCGTPSNSQKVIRPREVATKVVSVAPSNFAESLIEYKKN